uniref:Putative ovule protein n=1 Tax=Solanum chacoense TaxID=4108 RepID=A0A0V0HHE5_SOLCH
MLLKFISSVCPSFSQFVQILFCFLQRIQWDYFKSFFLFPENAMDILFFFQFANLDFLFSQNSMDKHAIFAYL